MTTTSTLHIEYVFDGPRKIDLPESALEQLDLSSLAESPLTFRIGSANSGNTSSTSTAAAAATTCVGVREFSASEAHCGLNAALAAELGLAVGDPLLIERVDLPKGSEVTLKTKNDNIDWKSLLEAWLPQNCTALSVGDALRIDYSGESHTLAVTSLAPADAVCIVDTDMDLIVETEASGTLQHDAAPPALVLDTEVDLGPELVLVSAAVPPGTKELFVRSSKIAYIGPEHATSESAFLAVAAAPDNSNVETTRVATAFLGPSFSVLASGRLEVSTSDLSALDSVTSKPVKDGEKLCSNCGNHVPEQSFLLHSNFCLRNSATCSECKRRFFGVRAVPADHWHCTRCAASGEGPTFHFHEHRHDLYQQGGGPCACREFSGETDAELAFHRATTCPLRLHICQFCHLLLPQDETSPVDAAQDLTGHEAQCGNRTTDCPMCNKPVRLRTLKMHLQEHDEQRRHRKPPQMCTNQNCPNVIRSGDSGDQPPASLGLCASCFGPLSVPGANTDVARVLSRAERRYILQMTRGCGKTWCQNQHCKTGSGKASSVGDSVAKARQIAAGGVHYFCVDEQSTRRAMFVQLDDSIYDRGWRGLAISSCASEVEATQWLERNASRLNESS